MALSSITRASAEMLDCRKPAFIPPPKHAVEGLTKAVALEFAPRGIRVNAVAPAAIETDMLDRFVGRDGERREWLRSLHPVGRIGTTDEIAAAVFISLPMQQNSQPARP